MTPQKPKILVMAPDLPYPVTSGGRRRMASLIQGMANFAAVHVICTAHESPTDCAQWLSRLGCTFACYRRRPHSLFSLWIGRMIMIICRCSLFYYPDEKVFIDRQFLEFQPDVVWLESPYLLRYALEWLARVPVIVDYWGTSEGARRDYANARGCRKIWEWFRWQAGRGGERSYAPRLRDIVTVTRLDGEFFRKISKQSRIWPIPMGIDVAAQGATRPEDPDALIMTGDLSFRPNVDAAQYFVREIFPLIRAKHPQARVRFVGRNPAPKVLALQDAAGVEVRGFVPDLSQVIAESAVYILPMRLGSGIRTKLFDVFPLEKPVVSTTVGVEGLELTHQEDCLIADTPQDFARGCCALLADESERRRLGANARKMALQLYAYENIAQLIKETVMTAIASFDQDAGAKQ
ncbi:MAG: glycosyltransferase family 4 protein [Kiritimatiellae bacterium]|nr:glycosyltransferase family 4 protein [Kiritimatiellia bacterium]